MSQPSSGYLYSRNLVLAKTSTTVSATANTTGVDVSQFNSNGITLILDTSAVAGSGVLTVAVEGSLALASGYSAISGASTTLSAAGLTLLFIPNFLGTYLRLAQTLVSGTSVTYTAIVYGDPEAKTTSEIYTNSPQ